MDITQFFTTWVDTSEALAASHEPTLVVASYLIAALAGFAFLRFSSRVADLADSIARFPWMVAGAVTMGLGVWAMHFVAMLAYRLPIPVGYDPIITTISVAPAVIGSFVALYVVARPSVTMLRIVLGGIAMGAGIGAMHYTGMAALRLDAFVRYDPFLFALSVVVAVALAFAALCSTLWTMRRSSKDRPLAREIAGALFMGLAVSGMHYTAMSSAYCFAAPGLAGGASNVDAHAFAFMTTIVASLVLIMATVGVVFDRRLGDEIAHRRAIQQQLHQAQKMESLGNLAGGIAHELNNMLLPILALSEITMNDLPEDHQGRENLRSVIEAASHAQDLVRQVMDFSRLDEAELGDVDISQSLNDALWKLRSELPPMIAMALDSMDPHAGTVRADSAQLEQVVMKLGSNAIDAMAGKTGELHVSLAAIDADAALESELPDIEAGTRYARFTMSDNGCGMDAETLDKIFNPFFTTKPVGKGTGLGLAVVHGIVQRCHGVIRVSSAIGVGTTVEVYLPSVRNVAAIAEAA